MRNLVGIILLLTPVWISIGVGIYLYGIVPILFGAGGFSLMLGLMLIGKELLEQ